jgi:hypothetical protein
MFEAMVDLGVRACFVAAATVVLSGCQLSGAPVSPSDAPHEVPRAAPHAPGAPDIQVITEEQAASRNLSGVALRIDFAGDDEDGTRMVSTWLDGARRRGSHLVGAITLYVVRPRASEGDVVECRTVFYPKDAVVPHTVPGGMHMVSVSRPVLRSVTRYEQRCQLVSQPVMRSETTYQSQYDFSSKSYRSVPQTRMVTHYEMRNECHTAPVTRLETQWEYGFETQFTPPRTEFLVRKELRETEPACYVAPEGAISRVEGTVYGVTSETPAPDAPAPDDDKRRAP